MSLYCLFISFVYFSDGVGRNSSLKLVFDGPWHFLAFPLWNLNEGKSQKTSWAISHHVTDSGRYRSSTTTSRRVGSAQLHRNLFRKSVSRSRKVVANRRGQRRHIVQLWKLFVFLITFTVKRSQQGQFVALLAAIEGLEMASRTEIY